MSIGQRLKTAMHSKERAIGSTYGQSDLARAIGVVPQTVQQWVSGRTSPKRARINKIATELNCDAVWLETGHAEPAGREMAEATSRDARQYKTIDENILANVLDAIDEALDGSPRTNHQQAVLVSYCYSEVMRRLTESSRKQIKDILSQSVQDIYAEHSGGKYVDASMREEGNG